MKTLGFDDRKALGKALGWTTVPRFSIQSSSLLTEWTTHLKQATQEIKARKGKHFKVRVLINCKIQIIREVQENCMKTRVWFLGSNIRFELYPELPDGIWVVWDGDRVLLKYEYSNVSWKDLEQVRKRLNSV